MTLTRNDGRSAGGRLGRRLGGYFARIVARREHDAAMQDPRIAAEHSFQIARATSHGEAGCDFCR